MQFGLRTIVAVVVALMLFALIPPVLTLLQISSNDNLITIFRVVIGFGALLYILKGPPVSIS